MDTKGRETERAVSDFCTIEWYRILHPRTLYHWDRLEMYIDARERRRLRREQKREKHYLLRVLVFTSLSISSSTCRRRDRIDSSPHGMPYPPDSLVSSVMFMLFVALFFLVCVPSVFGVLDAAGSSNASALSLLLLQLLLLFVERMMLEDPSASVGRSEFFCSPKSTARVEARGSFSGAGTCAGASVGGAAFAADAAGAVSFVVAGVQTGREGPVLPTFNAGSAGTRRCCPSCANPLVFTMFALGMSGVTNTAAGQHGNVQGEKRRGVPLSARWKLYHCRDASQPCGFYCCCCHSKRYGRCCT